MEYKVVVSALKRGRKGLNSNQIKLIAIAAMTIAHLTWAFFPGLQHVWYVFALQVDSSHHVVFHCGGMPFHS